MNIAIEANQLSKYFRDKRVINQISFQVDQGEIFGLFGRNGAGKSTTLNMLTGIIHPTSGEIRILGEPIEQLSKVIHRIGVLTENQTYFDEMTALDHLLLFANMHGGKIKRQSLRELLRKVDLDPNSSKPVSQFSQGMKKKLGIAQAMIGKPECLFLDEPTSLLDGRSVKAIHRLLKDFAKGGTAVFLTSANAKECEEICDRIAVLENGRIQREVTAAQLIQSSRAIHVRIRTGPINKEWLQVLRRRISQECHATLKADEQGFEVRIADQEMIPILLHVLHDENVPIFEVQQLSSIDSLYLH